VVVTNDGAERALVPAVRPEKPEGSQMHIKQQRSAAVVSATLAALALSAAPAFAGENDDGDDDEGSVPEQVAPSSDSTSSSSGATVPQGGVATGAGGPAQHGPDSVLLGLASGALVLLASGGGLIAVARRSEF
jgi:hypothetical protein